MSTFGDNVKRRRTTLGMTQEELAGMIGLKSKSSIARIEAGKTLVSSDKILQLANALSTTVDELIGPGSDVIPIGNLGTWRIPIVSRVAAGKPIKASENIIGWLDWQRDPHDEVFALKISGDSMEPQIRDGDVIVVDTAAEWRSGDIVVVTVNGDEGTCKRIQLYKDGLSLVSLNPVYPPMAFARKQVEQLPIRIVGKVVESRHRF